MSYGALTEPRVYIDRRDCVNLRNTFKMFKNTFLNKDIRPRLQGCYIYIEDDMVFNSINQKFLHSVTIEDKKNYNIFPCNNDKAFLNCKSECQKDHKANLSCAQIEGRALCYYRMARVHWILEIVNLANNNDPNIKIWSQEYRQKGRSRVSTIKRFVWYKKGLANYILIFEEKYKNRKLNILNFRTGYPVFYRRSEEQFIEEYEKYQKKIKKSPVLS